MSHEGIKLGIPPKTHELSASGKVFCDYTDVEVVTTTHEARKHYKTLRTLRHEQRFTKEIGFLTAK